jgi:hypothetical protein
MLLIILLLCTLLLVACENDRSDIIFVGGDKVCNMNGTYCHLFRTNSEVVNISFPNGTGDFYYEVDSV